MTDQHRIRTTCSVRRGITAYCSCGTWLTGSFYPLDLESVNDWMREHWIVAHATRAQLLWLSLGAVRGNEHLRLVNWGDLRTP